ncbi:hypothetical protein ScPMuIL_010901 [Solemya velum]
MEFLILICVFLVVLEPVSGMSSTEKKALKEKVKEMFRHAYNSYMTYARPADELMPLSCKGRYRDTEPSRGDIDETLGNFTLTLIDTLDTLVVLNEVEEFEIAVRHVIEDTSFDSDIVVSVFETNIRVLGGLLSGHILALHLKKIKKAMSWYNGELLTMAKEIGYRLLPAFNTTTGIPFPRINLRNGMDSQLASRNQDTCTACAGTMILEFAALSRLTGHKIFEDKAHKAMDYLWKQRHRSSDLVGTVINVHSGDWIRRESGVGAGIDSYYEYVLKAYILLGDDIYLDRFNKHYDAVMKYVSQGPMLMDVHMHKPQSTSKHFMDALLAFWPGLQVLKGDIKPAIETHEMLYQVVQKHNFLPEAFTTDFRVHWGQHPLRPEFVESTYFLYKATGDPHYLDVGKVIIEKLNRHARVPCGFAAIKDVTLGTHEDQMDSFVLAETFKYLYLLFSEKSDLLFDVDDYIFTTEAHLLPLSLSIYNSSRNMMNKLRRESYSSMTEGKYQPQPQEIAPSDRMKTSLLALQTDRETCPNPQNMNSGLNNYAHELRLGLKNLVHKVNIEPPRKNQKRLLASEFVSGNADQLAQLAQMGIRIATMKDGRIQLLHTASEASSPEYAEEGMKFMQEMIELSKSQQSEGQHEPVSVTLMSPPYEGTVTLRAGPAQFGYNLKTSSRVQGQLIMSKPFGACTAIVEPSKMVGKIAVLQRGDCMFVDKARHIQDAGAIGGIVIDNTEGSSVENQPLFAMSGDGKHDVGIPMVFLFHLEGMTLMEAMAVHRDIDVVLAHVEKQEESQSAQPVEPTPNIRQKAEETDSNSGTSDTETGDTTSEEGFMHLSSFDSSAMKFKMEVEVIPDRSQTKSAYRDEDIIQLIENPDGSKRLSIRFDQLLGKSPDRKLGFEELYTNLLNILQERTNFVQLANQADYLLAISNFLEAAYYGSSKVDTHSQNIIRQLGNELKIITFPETEYVNSKPRVDKAEESVGKDHSSEDNPNSHSMMPKDPSPMGHYSTEKELSDLGNPIVQSPDANIAKTYANAQENKPNPEDNVHKPLDSSFPSIENTLYSTKSVPEKDADENELMDQTIDHTNQNFPSKDTLKDENSEHEHKTPHQDGGITSGPQMTEPVQSNETKFDKLEL